MRCIFCSAERAPSLEHIFSLAIGGTITTDRVCTACNSLLGSRVDAALSDFLPIRIRRAELGLAGNGGNPPSMLDVLVGDQKLVGVDANRVQTTLNKVTGKLEYRQLYHAVNVATPDGKHFRQITLDARDADQIPKIIQRERKRHGLPPLSSEELATEATNFKTKTVEPLLVHANIKVSFAFLRQAMTKIAYELAFRWLGESYLDDPLAAELRNAILKDDIASADYLAGYVGWADSCSAFNFWIPHRAHHLAFASVVEDSLIVAARIFDIYAVAMPVSRVARRYIKTETEAMNLPFLAIDAANRATTETTFGAEQQRLAYEMSKHGRSPPFSDPLFGDCHSNP